LIPSEWWTYAPQDFLLFSRETYERLFALHNEAVWPMHLYALALALALVLFGRRCSAGSGRIVGAILAMLWVWVAWSFHYERYATIHLAGGAFAVGFAVQAALLLLAGPVLGRLEFCPDRSRAALLCFGVFLFSLFIQPLLGLFVGRDLHESELFGFAPDPTALGTLGLLGAARRPAWLLMLIPLAWCAITGLTLWTMGAPLWFVTPALAALVLAASLARTARRRR
jgi:hypothetical protein